jgi:hypothetical protein
MGILKGRRPTLRDKIRSFHLNQYWGMSLLLLCIPLLPPEVPRFHSFFRSRYWLTADALLLWAIGAWLERRLYAAIELDARERESGSDALNVSSLLFFATPILFLLNCAATVHLFAMQFASADALAIGLDARLRCAAVMIGLVCYVYGRFLPGIPFGSIWGIPSPAAKRSARDWEEAHCSYARRMVIGGALLLPLGLMLPGTPALTISAAAAAVLFLSCFLPSNQHK